MKLVTEPGVLQSVSEERDTEWKEDMEDAGACPGVFLDREGSILRGGYVCKGSTVRESDGWRVLSSLKTGDGADLSERIEGFRGGRGGAENGFGFG